MTEKIKFKKGKYYIGDPCYCLDYDSRWHINSQNSDGIYKNGVIDGTAYGDGKYFDQDENEYFVDSGTLSILPLRVIPKEWNKGVMADGKGYKVVKYKEDFEVEIDNGKFQFGHIEIDTTGEDEEEDECPHCGQAIH